MIAIIDYGVGNLFSLSGSLDALGIENVITNDKAVIEKSSHIILPGVGAFKDAIDKLNNTGLVDFLKQQVNEYKKPLLGICLGMQLLFEESFEYGEHKGLGLIPGKVMPLKGAIKDSFKIPHIGWNELEFTKENPLFKYIKEGDFVYFVHSFYATNCQKNLLAVSEYDIKVTAAVANENIFGAQFHPEKSGNVGLSILKAFSEI